PRAAGAHGDRSAHRVAPGVAAEPETSVRRAADHRRLRGADPARRGHARRLGLDGYRARRVRRSHGGAGVRPRRARAPSPGRRGVMPTGKRERVDGAGRPDVQPSTEVGIRSDLREDLYSVLGGVVNGTEQAVFRFTINPLVWWVWYGGLMVNRNTACSVPFTT